MPPPRSLDPGLLYLTRPPPCDLCGALLPSRSFSINSRALSSASRCLLSSLTTPPLSLGQTPLFMILSNPYDTDICSLIGDILCEELARQLAGIRPLHAEQKERDSWVFLTGFSDARRSLGSNQYRQPPTALVTRDTSQLTPTNRRYSATATC